MASLVAASGVLVALVGRQADPERRGVHLDISIQEAVAMAVLQTANANQYTWHGIIPGRPGMASPVHCCADGRWVAVNIRADRFSIFVRWLHEAGIETDLAEDGWYEARAAALGRPNRIAQLLSQLAAHFTRDAFLEEAWRRDVIAQPFC